MTEPWRVGLLEGTPGELHGWIPPNDIGRVATWCRPTAGALVLGSTQPASVVDAAGLEAAGIPAVRRRSGGGAVLVIPGDIFWVDLVIPRNDILWEDDVIRASGWVGRLWVDTLAGVGVAGAVAQDQKAVALPGGDLRREWSRLACFAGLSASEVVAGGRKVVGVCQRRTREQAVFHCGVLLVWRPDDLVSLLALDPQEREVFAVQLTEAATGVGSLVTTGLMGEGDPGHQLELQLWEALVAALPD